MKTLLAKFGLLVCAANAVIVMAQDVEPDPHVVAASKAIAMQETTAWTDLFNGKDLTGWMGDIAGYAVQDGILICNKGGMSLATEKEYSDFALRFEFKLEESGNNGIGIRVPKDGHPSRDGMEIQILDHDGKAYNGEAVLADGKTQKLSWLKPWQYHGSIYGIYPAKTGYLKPIGEWNTETIIAIEDHLMVIVNGAVVVDAFLDDITPVDGDPHAGMKNKHGHIVLAGHDDRVEFKNLQLADYAITHKTNDDCRQHTTSRVYGLFQRKRSDRLERLSPWQCQRSASPERPGFNRRSGQGRCVDERTLDCRRRNSGLRRQGRQPLYGKRLWRF